MSALDPFEEPPLEEPRQGGSAPPMGADWLLGGEEPPLVEEPAPDPPDYGVPEVQFTVQSNGLFSFGPMPGEELFSDPDPLDAPPGLGDGYAIETRAEAIKVLTLGDSVRRGDLDMVQIGDAAVTDMVTGSETTTISGKLREQTGGGLTYTAARVETTVEGRMSITSDMEDGILLGGAMTDTWIGGTFIAAAMSDDLCAGAGARVTAPVDLWLNTLTGLEERPGTAASDGVFIDLCGTLFEREYGPGMHAASTAVFTGTTYQTQKTGFRPMMRVAMGVRDLMPGAGAASEEAAAPAPPPAPSAGGGAVLAGSVVVAGAGTARGVANVAMGTDAMVDLFRAGETAADVAEMENAANLRHAADTASQIEDLQTAARRGADLPDDLGGLHRVEAPPGDGPSPSLDNAWQPPLTPSQLASAELPSGFESLVRDALMTTERTIDDDLIKIEQIRTTMMEQVNTLIGQKLEDLENINNPITRVSYDPDALPTLGGQKGQFLSDPDIQWPGTAAEGAEARRAQLQAEVDALFAIKAAFESFDDPHAYLQNMMGLLSDSSEIQRQAHVDAMTFYDHLMNVYKSELDNLEKELDINVLVRQELLAGRDPQVILGTLSDSWKLDEADEFAFTAQTGFRWAGEGFKQSDQAKALIDSFQTQATNLRAAANAIDTSTEAGVERAAALRKVADTLDQSASNMSRFGMDPRSRLLGEVRALEAKQFLDGGTGAGEASILRAAIAETAMAVDDFRSGLGLPPLGVLDVPPASVSSDLLGSPPSYLDLSHSEFRDEFAGFAAPPSYNADLGFEPVASYFLRGGDSAVPPAQLDLPGFRPFDVEGDDVRQLLDVELEQVVNVGEDAGGAYRLELDNGPGRLGPDLGVESGPGRTGVDGSGLDGGIDVAPQLDAAGARWEVETGPRPTDPDTGRPLTEGDYAGVTFHADAAGDGASGGEPAARAVPPDTQAVVDAMPDGNIRQSGPDGEWPGFVDEAGTVHGSGSFDVAMRTLDDRYMALRRASNWRGTLAYEEAITELRADLVKALVDLGGYTPEAADAMPSATAAYRALWDVLGDAHRADDAAEAQRVRDFLAGFHARTQDSIADLANRVGEFDSTTKPLDPHIDRQKLQGWLTEQRDDAMRRMAEAVEAGDHDAASQISNEMTYFQQLVLAMEEGRNPLLESGDQIAYLRGTGKAEQADEYLAYQLRMTDVLSDPDFHRSAAEMGGATYGPGLLSVSSLEDTAVAGNVDTDVFRAQVREPGDAPAAADDGVQLDAGNYAANRDTINERLGEGDFVRVPEEQPEGLSASATPEEGPTIVEVEDPGDVQIHANNADARLNAQRQAQGEVHQHMDALADAAGDEAEAAYWRANPDGTDDEAWRARRQAEQRARLDVANAAWDTTTGADLRSSMTEGATPRQQPFSRNGGSRQLRFDDSRLVSYGDDWRPTRQPGFGRTAAAPGEFPFSVRENLLNSLMKGQSTRGSAEVAALQAEFARARSANYGGHSSGDWRKMAMLLRNLQVTQPGDAVQLARLDAAQNARFVDSLGAAGFGDSTFASVGTAAFITANQATQMSAFAQSLDWKSLGKLLDLFDAGSAVA